MDSRKLMDVNQYIYFRFDAFTSCTTTSAGYTSSLTPMSSQYGTSMELSDPAHDEMNVQKSGVESVYISDTHSR